MNKENRYKKSSENTTEQNIAHNGAIEQNKDRRQYNNAVATKGKREFHSYQEYAIVHEASAITGLKDGDFFSGIVKILRKAVPGPVVLIVSDGFSCVDAVAKECDYNAGDVVKLSGSVSARADKLQIEIKRISKANIDFESIILEKSKPVQKQISIESQKLEKLKPYFEKIAWAVRKAILNNQPILIRHHADADGITSGIAIEKACELLMVEAGINPGYNLYRSPSKAPFYEIIDVLKDISFTKKLLEAHGQVKPLIIVMDNGSTPEDEFAMKLLKSMGFDVIVIDHHNPVVLDKTTRKTAVCPYVMIHLNPYIEGFDGQLTAGMLAFEVARLIHSDFDNGKFENKALPIISSILPAISSVGDRSKLPEAEAYVKNSGLSNEEVSKLVIAMDFLAYQLKFDPGRGIYEELFHNPTFVEMINAEVSQGVETQLQSALPYLRTQEINGVTFSHIDLEKYTLRFKYPTPGKVTGMIHDIVAEGKENKPVITLGYLSDMVILRATKPVLPIAKIIATLQKELPQASVDGGGHECAGAIKFVNAHLDTVLESIKRQVKEIKFENDN